MTRKSKLSFTLGKDIEDLLAELEFVWEHEIGKKKSRSQILEEIVRRGINSYLEYVEREKRKLQPKVKKRNRGNEAMRRILFGEWESGMFRPLRWE
jgi:hypothetical protein